jgi:putative ABC transport system permease protein
MTVVGVVADARNLSPSREPLPAAYVPLRQARLLPRVTLLIRTTINPSALATSVEQQVWSVDKDAPITDVKTLDQVLAETVAEPRFQTWLLSIFATVGLTIALVGIYGLIAYAVSGRFREFGVRLAIGAQPRDIAWLVLRESIPAVGLGLLAGIGIAVALTQFLKSLLFAIAPTDPATYVGVAALMASVAFLAYCIPARRAAGVDPVRVLRDD